MGQGSHLVCRNIATGYEHGPQVKEPMIDKTGEDADCEVTYLQPYSYFLYRVKYIRYKGLLILLDQT